MTGVISRLHQQASLVELLERAAQPGPVRRALEHTRGCAHCSDNQLCETGERLASKIKPSPARTRGWLALRSAAVAQARARKRESRA